MSESEPWYAGFDVVDFESTPMSELPEDDGFHLICPVEGCDHEADFDDLPAVADSGWSEMSRKDHILTDGTTLKEAYCPAHSLDETETTASESIEEDFEQFISELQDGLGEPLDARESPQKPDRAKAEYAMYDFAEGEVTLDGSLLTCGHDSCYQQEEVDAPEDAEGVGWVSGQMVGILSDGQMLFEGRCPEHRE
ncbi:hypothetical protein AMS69_05560 [Haloarcula rubripromontorii]|uniref:Uncharacterized protein n=1 Tax=Haloarcula rubripromontorii TaxID=1705562 RepID=A0A0N0BP82_9EURY|nr:hypothetical protein [Haloarcula rubripromontorii]KOX93396.1 hypothetical protein AMS69_05560 [Haloarcula rubripromontorii]